ncbi:hypothetical protein Scep_020128 [Stephania cephalantha]|uniref:Serine/threonine protein phosphatase 2A regulatory subunit n=1 Tax=Stephania cephalantha TaxID=152367 RepID=A0AAP0IC19_9MAGN
MGAEKNSPKTPTKKRSTTLQYLFNLEAKNNGNKNNITTSLSRFTTDESSFEVENEELLSMISYCTCVFTFNDPAESPSQQDLKKIKLIQLLSTIKSSPMPLDRRIMSPLVSMLSTNLFRPLPPPSNASHATAEFPDDEDMLTVPTPAWPHLQIVYDILLRLVLNSDPKTLRFYIDQPFLLNLLNLFQSEDPRERESVKNVFHRIYTKFQFYRSFMRKAMNDVFFHFVYETDRHCGVGDLLEIWGSIINGFSMPLKEEHKQFLLKVLIPLHKPRCVQAYHRQLAYCVSQFLQKEPLLGGIVVKEILRYWPITNCQKELLLLGELEDLLENIDQEQFRKLARPLCTVMAKCLSSCNLQVAERALFFWNNEYFAKMASQATEDVFPVVVERIEKNLKLHWCRSVRELTANVKSMLEEMDPFLYYKCLEELKQQESRAGHEDLNRKKRWERLELAAAKSASHS